MVVYADYETNMNEPLEIVTIDHCDYFYIHRINPTVLFFLLLLQTEHFFGLNFTNFL